MSKDTIYRQVAIDVVTQWYDYSNATGRSRKSGIVKILKSVPSAQPEDYAHGFADGYIQGKKDAQPEIIRCEYCKHHRYDKEHIPYCSKADYGYGWKDDDFCSKAERKNNG